MNEDLLHRLEAYFSQQLSEAEMKSLEADILADERLAEQVKIYAAQRAMVMAEGDRLLAEKLRQRGEAARKEAPVKPLNTSRRSPWLAVGIAAALLLLAAIFLYPSLSTSGPDLQALYAANYEPQPAPGMRSQGEMDSLWQAGVLAYSQKDYAGAIALWENLPDTRSAETLFYLGQSYLELDQPDQALTYFRQIAEESSLYDRSQWQIALTLLKSGDVPTLRTHLASLLENPYFFKKEAAQALLEAL
ncbi:MAG: tetratricopeptide repeat protein [Bacteroidota bacterium]